MVCNQTATDDVDWIYTLGPPILYIVTGFWVDEVHIHLIPASANFETLVIWTPVCSSAMTAGYRKLNGACNRRKREEGAMRAVVGRLLLLMFGIVAKHVSFQGSGSFLQSYRTPDGTALRGELLKIHWRPFIKSPLITLIRLYVRSLFQRTKPLKECIERCFYKIVLLIRSLSAWTKCNVISGLECITISALEGYWLDLS